MFPTTKVTLLTLTALSVVSSGCSSTRYASHQRHGTLIKSGLAEPARTRATAHEAPVVTDVGAVVFHQDDTNTQADGSTDAVDLAQRTQPLKAEGIEITDVGLTLEAIEQLALANNPAIKQANAASARAAGMRVQVGLKPNPTIGYFGEEIGNEGSEGLQGAFVSQIFLRGEKLAWNRQVHGHDVKAMNLQTETQRERVRTDVRLAFYDALAAQKRLQIAKEFRSVAQEGVIVSEERMEAKVGTRPDILQSQIQLGEIDLAIKQAEFELSAAINELAALVGVREFGTTEIIGELDVSVEARDTETEFALILAKSPQLAAAQVWVDRARDNIQRQQVQPIPNVKAQLGAGGDSATGTGFANVQLSIPVPVHNKNQGNIRAAQAEYCAATNNLQRIRQSIRLDLARVMREYKIAEATVRQYQVTILPKAEETLKLMKEAQSAGEFDFLRVLTARRSYIEANLKLVTAMGQLAKANAKLDGLLLTGGLSNVEMYDMDDSLRGQALGGQ